MIIFVPANDDRYVGMGQHTVTNTINQHPLKFALTTSSAKSLLMWIWGDTKGHEIGGTFFSCILKAETLGMYLFNYMHTLLHLIHGDPCLLISGRFASPRPLLHTFRLLIFGRKRFQMKFFVTSAENISRIWFPIQMMLNIFGICTIDWF